jgi:beta-lactamase regulating signal transducer with metallopeptidase domain
MLSVPHVFWAMINALWQSAAIALIVGTSLRFIPRTTAAQRYVMWCAVLVAAALLPIADLAMPSRTIALPVSEPPSPVVARVVSDVVLPQPVKPATGALAQTAAAQPAHHLPSPLLFVWLGIAAVLLVRLGLAYASLRTVKSSLVTSDALTARVQGFAGAWSRRAVVGVSRGVAEPCAIGFLHPAIALSDVMAAALPDGDLERVLRHEYAHVRRYDDYSNLVQRLLAAVLWFNPIVHIAGRAMAIEREIACDDAAAAASDERVAFARCLYEIARTAPRRRHAAASGFIGSRRQIAVRGATRRAQPQRLDAAWHVREDHRDHGARDLARAGRCATNGARCAGANAAAATRGIAGARRDRENETDRARGCPRGDGGEEGDTGCRSLCSGCRSRCTHRQTRGCRSRCYSAAGAVPAAASRARTRALGTRPTRRAFRRGIP